MVEITEEEYKQFEVLKKVYIHSELAEKHPGLYFICGEGGNKDSIGLPEFISVCPAHGMDGFAMYKKHTKYKAPGY